MLRLPQHGLCPTLLDDAPRLHHCHLVGDVLDDAGRR